MQDFEKRDQGDVDLSASKLLVSFEGTSRRTFAGSSPQMSGLALR